MPFASAPPRVAASPPGPVVTASLAGLPSAVLGQLRFPRSTAGLTELVRARSWLADEGAALAAALDAIIAETPQVRPKLRLVGLRRSLHQARPPAEDDWAAHLASALPRPLVRRIQHWEQTLHAERQAHAQLPGLLAEETSERRAALRHAAADPGFRAGLERDDQPLAAELAKWLANPDRRPRRRVLFRLADTLAQAAAVPRTDAAFATGTPAAPEFWGRPVDPDARVRARARARTLARAPLTPIAPDTLPAWRPALDDLDPVRRWLAVLDARLPLRLALGEVVERRLGAGARLPFPALHALAREALAERGGGQAGAAAAELRRLLVAGDGLLAEPGSAFAAVRRLARWQGELFHVLRQAPEVGGAEPVTRVNVAEVRARLALRPGWLGALPAPVCRVQPAGHEDDPLLVLGDLRPGGTDAGPVRARHDVERLPLRDLTVAHDPESGTLRLHGAGGAELAVAHPGTARLAALPPPARLLAQVFGASAPCWPQVLAALRMPGDDACGVRRVPRLTAGRVVLSRRAWVVPAGLLPVRSSGESDAAYLLRLTSWRREQAMPERCLVRLVDGPSRTARAAAAAGAPRYLDFASWFLVLSIEHLARTPGATLIFEEALPDPLLDTARVSELLVGADRPLGHGRESTDA